MSALLPTDEVLIEKLLAHLKAEGYSLRIQQWYPARVRQLLYYCNSKALPIESVRSAHLRRFLCRQYRLSQKRHSNLPPFQKWRHRYTGAVNMMLRLVHGAWPIPDPPRTALEAFHRNLVDSYDAWLRDLRGLSPQTRTKRTARALQFLASLGPRADKESLASLSVQEIDAYVRHCCAGLGRGRRRGPHCLPPRLLAPSVSSRAHCS